MTSPNPPDPKAREYTAAANAIPIALPIDLLAARKPDALLRESCGTNPMMALLFAGKKMERPAPPIVMTTKYRHIGASVSRVVSTMRPHNSVRWPTKEVNLVPNLSDNTPLIGDSTSRIVWNGRRISPAIDAE